MRKHQRVPVETAQISARPSNVEAMRTGPKEPANLLYRYGWDMLVVLAMGISLYIGLFGQMFSDASIYQCYAVAFWGGLLPALTTLPSWQCSFLLHPQAQLISPVALVQWMLAHHLPAPLIHIVASQTPDKPLHALPYEYPLPALIPFSLPMIAPPDLYAVIFAISMSLLAAVVYGLLRYFRSRGAAGVYARYVVISGWATAAGRFDLVPSALTLVAIIFGVRKRWNWAFAFLALAIVFKFYPLWLLLPFLLAQQLGSGEKWMSWRRFAPLAVFAAVCMVVMAVSLCLSVGGTLAPLSYFANRPFQVESVAASLLWLFHFLGYPLSPVSAYGSFSVLSPLSSQVSLIDTLLLGAGLLYTWWLQWRGKVDLAASCLLTLLIVIFTGKVFSPQYLLWVIPLAAYVGEWKPRWVVAWCLLGGLTTCIFPYLYTVYSGHFNDVSDAPLFYAVIAIRNLFLFCMIVSLLFSYSRKQPARAVFGKIEPGLVLLIQGFSWTSRWINASARRSKTSANGDVEDRTVMMASPVWEQKKTPQFEDSSQPLLLWHKLALGAVLAISAFFNFFALDKQDFFEYYYAAAIKSMSMSWHNFFFASFDPGGFLALDKPPLSFWAQALSAKLFGYSVVAVLLPGALAGVLAVVLMFHLVRRVFGPLAGLIAALVLALSPISVATNRNNIVDGLLVLTVLLATWMVSKAAETGRLRWLCLCAVLIGLGFNIKYLQAYMVIPAFGLVYWLGAPVRRGTKLCHFAVALGVLLLVSLCWVTIVDLTPTNQRPYIDSITTDSELDLAFGYNGTFRLIADSNIVNNWAWEIGKPGIMRLFEQPLAGQCSWLLPLALFSLLVLGMQKRWRLPLNRQQQALVLWGTWLLTMFVFFSNAHFFHLYYLSMLAPAIAALVGAGIVALWQEYIRRGWRGWLLPCALLVTAAVQAYFLAPFSQWGSLLVMSIIGCFLIVELVPCRFLRPEAEQRFIRSYKDIRRKRKKIICMPAHQQNLNEGRVIVLEPHLQQVAMMITGLGLLSLLLAPMVWAAIPLTQEGRAFPIAGPLPQQAHIAPLVADPVMVRYLLAHKGKAPILLVTMNTEEAAPFILDTGQVVIALGGYDDSRSFLTRDQVIQLIDHGAVHFFLLYPSSNQAMSWVMTHCGLVPTHQWQSRSTDRFSIDVLQLYDCAHQH